MAGLSLRAHWSPVAGRVRKLSDNCRWERERYGRNPPRKGYLQIINFPKRQDWPVARNWWHTSSKIVRLRLQKEQLEV